MNNAEGFAERALQGAERRRIEANRRRQLYGARSRPAGVVPDRGGSGLSGSRPVFGGA